LSRRFGEKLAQSAAAIWVDVERLFAADAGFAGVGSQPSKDELSR
jgi:hypothetical protein